MDYVPLTIIDRADNSDRCHQQVDSLGLDRSVWNSLVRWWELTTSSVFLSSSISRRDSALSIWLGMFVVALALDFNWGNIKVPGSQGFLDYSSLAILCLDCFLIGYVLSLRKFSTRTLRFDIALALGLVAFCAIYRSFRISNNWNEIVFLAVACATGVHSSVVCLFRVISISTPLLMQQKMHYWTEASVGLFFCYVSIIIELRSAVLLSELHDKTLSREKLLDQVTAGFCEIDVASGIVTNASAKLECTLAGKEWLHGSSFSSFLCTHEDRTSFELMLVDASVHRDLRSILVTCRISDTKEFDAKLIPLISKGSSIVICFQTLGESRELPISAWLGTEDNFDKSAEGNAVHLANRSTIDECVDFSESGTVFSATRGSCGGAATLSSLAYSLTLPSVHEKGVSHSLLHDMGTQTLELDIAHSGVQTETSSLRPPLIPSVAPEISRYPPRKHLRTPHSSRKSLCNVILNSRHRALHQFKATPKDTINLMIMDIMEKSNLHGKGCCYWHVSLMAIRQVITDMVENGRGCQVDFSPYKDWQCQQCYLVHEYASDDDPDERSCDFCGSVIDPRASDSPMSSA